MISDETQCPLASMLTLGPLQIFCLNFEQLQSQCRSHHNEQIMLHTFNMLPILADTLSPITALLTV